MTGDIFVFAYSWTPQFCYNQPTYEGCFSPDPSWSKYFTLHGLWPQYSTGGYPSTCTTETFNSTVPDAVGWDDMYMYWPNVQLAEGDPNYSSFWNHEWSKHGTCTGLSQYDYFEESINLVKKLGTPTSVTANVGGTLSAGTLRSDFGGSDRVALQCNSEKYLSGAYTCWSQSEGVPTAQITCPTDVLSEDTCSASDLVITVLQQ